MLSLTVRKQLQNTAELIHVICQLQDAAGSNVSVCNAMFQGKGCNVQVATSLILASTAVHWDKASGA